MPRVVCRYIDCVYLENGVCSSENIMIDPDEGCLTYAGVNDLAVEDPWDDDLEGYEAPDDDDEDDDDQGLLFDEDDDEDDWMD
ncbi:MAG: hypothetical protein JXA25_17395 [Anaerolineales bacterium]|nr:hypothetical protein [Anaerolineales bacterium]